MKFAARLCAIFLGVFTLLLIFSYGSMVVFPNLGSAETPRISPELASEIKNNFQKNVSHLETLNSSKEVEDFIETELSRYGYEIGVQSVTDGGVTFPNIEVEKLNADSEKQNTFIIGVTFGAKEDVVPLAMNLELARVAKLRERTNEPHLRFVYFGNKNGSGHYISELQKKEIPIVGMIGISLRNAGTSDQLLKRVEDKIPLENTLGIFGNFQSNNLLQKITKSLKANSRAARAYAFPFPFHHDEKSDHWRFSEAGYPGVLVSIPNGGVEENVSTLQSLAEIVY